MIVNGPGGHRSSVALRSGVTAESIPGSMAAARQGQPNQFDTGGNVTYHSPNPVMHSMTTYALYWDPGNLFTAATKNVINQYFTDLAAASNTNTSAFSVVQQYSDTTGYAGFKQTFGGARSDTDAYPANGCNHFAVTATVCLKDSQLVTELNSFITANALPKGMSTEYFLFTPTNVVTCLATNTCSDDTYCAYHRSSGSGASTLLYADDPFTSEYDPADDPAAVKGCQFDNNSAIQQPNGDIADVVLKAVSHEARETQSDPLLNAWFDVNGNELDDKCNAYGTGAGVDTASFTPTLGGSAGAGTLFNQTFNGHNYYLQSEWSNGESACRMAPTAGTITPSFTVPPGAGAGHPMSFSGSATSTNAISTHSWDFGDGTLAKGQTPSHTYGVAGTYNVTLTVSDVNGNATSVTHPVSTFVPATAAFSATPSPAPTGSAIAFNAGATTPGDGPITGYDWNFGGGSPHGSGVTTSHTYPHAGVYTVTLSVSDTNLLTGTTTHQVTATNRLPTGAFTFSPGSGVIGGAVSFDGSSSSDPDGTVASYAWDFGDGSAPAAGATVAHAYLSGGPHTVKLTVTDNEGGTALKTRNVTVNAATINALSFSYKSFSAAGSGATVTRKKKKRVVGSTLRITLSAAANVTVTITKQSPGRRNAKHKCVALTRKLNKAAKCTRATLLSGSASFAATAGTSAHKFSGRFRGRKLAPGRYILRATPAGGTAKTVGFTIKR